MGSSIHDTVCVCVRRALPVTEPCRAGMTSRRASSRHDRRPLRTSLTTDRQAQILWLIILFGAMLRALSLLWGVNASPPPDFRRELPPGRNQVLQQRAGLPGVVFVKPPLHLPLLSIQPRLLLIEHERSILRGPTLLSAIVPGERLASAGLVEVSVGSQDGRSAPMSFPIR